MNKVKSQKGIGIVQLSAFLVVIFIILGVFSVVLLGDNGLIQQYKTGRTDLKSIILMQAKKTQEEPVPVGQLEENVPLVDENLISQLQDEDTNILLKSMILEYKVNNGEKVTLPIGENYYDTNIEDIKESTCNLMIDWGDETSNTIIDVNDENLSHTYEKEGTYDIKLVGTLDSINTKDMDMSNLIKIKQWGNLKAKNIIIKNAKNLESISNPSLNSFIDLKYISFEGCEKIFEIPNLLLANATQLISCKNLFYGCENIKQIPENLFRNCNQLKDVSGTFGECISLEIIPDKLFEYATHISDFSKLFFMCDMINEIPSNLFNSNEATTFESAFARCIAIKNIPEGLFSKCCNAENFKSVFADCRNIKEIPKELFKENNQAKTFEQAFINCTALESVPNELFEKNGNVTSYQETFANCINIKGNVPKLWVLVNDDSDYIGTPNGKACYNNCSKVSKYKEIPNYWTNY